MKISWRKILYLGPARYVIQDILVKFVLRAPCDMFYSERIHTHSKSHRKDSLYDERESCQPQLRFPFSGFLVF